jgi:MFS family permease
MAMKAPGHLGASAFSVGKGKSVSACQSQMLDSDESRTAIQPVGLTLAPIMAAVFVSFLVIGMGMPVLPLHVHQNLGYDSFMVGIVAGSQFAVSLVTRIWAGNYADRRGAGRAVIVGLMTSAAAGGLYLVSLLFVGTPFTSVMILLMGRVMLGAAESFIITGALALGLGMLDARHSGKVIAWVGTGMFAAFAVGAPLGSLLFSTQGFVAVALATLLLPLATLSIARTLPKVPTQPRVEGGVSMVASAVWLPGFGLGFASLGLGAITTFITLLYVERGWNAAWLAFTVFAVFFILARALFGHLPDRVGGARVALACSLIEASGLGLIWFAQTPAIVLAGAALTGAGYSLVYPGLGIEAVRRAPSQNRALAMGSYTAFLDLSLGVTSPALGLIGARTGLGTVFLVSSIAVLGAAGVAMGLMRRKPAV